MLTKVALKEPDPDKFIEYLIKRDPYIGESIKK